MAHLINPALTAADAKHGKSTPINRHVLMLHTCLIGQGPEAAGSSPHQGMLFQTSLHLSQIHTHSCMTRFSAFSSAHGAPATGQPASGSTH